MKIVIIGGGLLGLSTARVLQENHHEVTLIEAREDIGLGASYANGGILTASMSDPWNAPGVYKHIFDSLFNPHSPMKLQVGSIPSLFFWGSKFLRNSSPHRYSQATVANYQLAQYAIRKTGELRDQMCLQYDSTSHGSLKVFRDADAMECSREIANKLAAVGLRFSELDAQGTIAVEPKLADIRDKIAGALYFPDDESGDANLFCQALASEIKKDGGSICAGVDALGLLVEKGRVIGVDTKNGVVEANEVVVATGAHTANILRNTGISLPIRPVKGYSITIKLQDSADLPRVPVIDDASHAVIASLGDRLRAVGTAEFAGYDTSIQPMRIDYLLNLVHELYPRISNLVDRTMVEPWAGLRPTSCDGKPFIGPSNIRGLYFNVGHGHLGWTMAMGSAHILVDLMSNRPPEIDSTPFRLDR